jgi:hypothetical protein
VPLVKRYSQALLLLLLVHWLRVLLFSPLSIADKIPIPNNELSKKKFLIIVGNDKTKIKSMYNDIEIDGRIEEIIFLYISFIDL